MKSRTVICLGLLALVASAAALAATLEVPIYGERSGARAPSRQGEVIEVEAVNLAFQPDTVNARVGDTIRWIQRDAFPHTVTSTNPAPDSLAGFDEPLVAKGDIVEVKLATAGTIEYLCRPHPFMTGVIVVREAAR